MGAADDKTNKWGLGRNIPTEIKRDVRRLSKFGCIICRQLICEYEHIDPVYAEASAHEADKICLLCPTHHSEVTRGLLSKDQVKKIYLQVQADSSIRPPFYEMHLSGHNLALVIGDSLFEYIPDRSPIISIDGEDLLHVKYERDPDTGVVFPSVSARLFDRNQNKLLEIEDNEIIFADTLYDIKTHGSTISVFTANGEYGVSVTITPPSRVGLNRLRMFYKGIELLFDGNFAVRIPQQPGTVLEIGMPGIEVKGASSAVFYSSAIVDRHDPNISLVGGVGVAIPATGLTFARGAASLLLKRFYICQLKPAV